MNIKTISRLSLILFLTGLLSLIFALLFPDTKIFAWILGAISIIYLFAGWYLFRGSYPEGKPVVLFFMGYFYSGIFIGYVFTLTKWPFAEKIFAGSVFWSIVQLVLLVILWKKIP